jgi:tetratricopeptide (TPR) repeat protein
MNSYLAIAVLIPALLLAQPDSLHIKSALDACRAGETAAQARQFQPAIDQFKKAIEIEPTFRDAFDGLISAYLSAGRRSDAAAAMTQLLQIEPNISRYRLLLGQILLEQHQAERALAQFSFALQIDPLNADALLGFATAARQLGMADRAADAMERGRLHYPNDSRFK